VALQPDLQQLPVRPGVGVEGGQGPRISVSAGVTILSSVPVIAYILVYSDKGNYQK
jgi:hypothetical protein